MITNFGSFCSARQGERTDLKLLHQMETLMKEVKTFQEFIREKLDEIKKNQLIVPRTVITPRRVPPWVEYTPSECVFIPEEE